MEDRFLTPWICLGKFFIRYMETRKMKKRERKNREEEEEGGEEGTREKKKTYYGNVLYLLINYILFVNLNQYKLYFNHKSKSVYNYKYI